MGRQLTETAHKLKPGDRVGDLIILSFHGRYQPPSYAATTLLNHYKIKCISEVKGHVCNNEMIRTQGVLIRDRHISQCPECSEIVKAAKLSEYRRSGRTHSTNTRDAKIISHKLWPVPGR